MFRENTTLALAGFHVASLSMSNQSLEVIAVFRRENPEKTLVTKKMRKNIKLDSYDSRLESSLGNNGWKQALHHSATPSPILSESSRTIAVS